MRKVSLLLLVAMLLLAAMPSFAGGPVYDELPDLEGAEVVVAMENAFVPFQFEDPRADAPIGFEYDLVDEACRRINCTPVYETTSFDLQLAGVQNGEYDAALNNLFIFPDRQEIYDFSSPYFLAETLLLVRADEDRFADINDFVAKMEDEELIFGAQANSFSQEIARDIYSIPEENVVLLDDFGALLLALQNGDVDAMAVDAFAGAFVSPNADAFKLIGQPVVDPIESGIIFTKGSEFAPAFSAAIDSMKADGYLDYLQHKWSVDFQPLAE